MSTTVISETFFRSTIGSEHPWRGIAVTETQPEAYVVATGWRPAVNAYRCAEKFVVFVDAAGMPADEVEVSAEPRRVIIRGHRASPLPSCEVSELSQLLALEIDHGAFERVLDLPQEIDPAGMTVDSRDGLLRIQLPLAG